MKIQDLQQATVVGLGLLGGSLGLAISRHFPHVKRIGYSHRAVTRNKAADIGAVDEIADNLAQAVQGSQLIILASPIGVFPDLMTAMGPHLDAHCLVTDVGSTKMLPVRWARKYLNKNIQFIGSHPMAGSEQRGVDFARADLFDDAYCILTPTPRTSPSHLQCLRQFWQTLRMRLSTMAPAQHDRVLARISHLPHALAAALVCASDPDEMLLCGKGFLDTTRIASGPVSVWRDILMTNAQHTAKAIARLTRQLDKLQTALENDNPDAVVKILSQAKEKRDDLVAKKLLRQDLPT